MPNASGYIDFNQYSDLNADEETRLMEEAMARAEAADATAQQALVRSSQEAIRTGAAGLSKVGSYADYLKAKKSAADAWAQLGRGADPRTGALRGALRSKLGVNDRAAASDFAGREERLGERVSDSYEEGLKRKAEQEAYAKRIADERAAREEAWKAAQGSYLSALARGARGRAAAGGAQRDFFGGFNPYADSSWAQQQGGLEAQRAKEAGASEEQLRGIWGAYTGKGRWGQGMPQDVRHNREREMSPWKK